MGEMGGRARLPDVHICSTYDDVVCSDTKRQVWPSV